MNDSVRLELHRLMIIYGGELTPDQVVKEGRDPASPLHHQFFWDDAIAGHQHRLQQARALLNRYEISYTRPDGSTTKVREFLSVPVGNGERRYIPIHRVVASEALLASVIADFDRLLRHFIQRVENHSDLTVKGRYQKVLDAIHEILEEAFASS